MPDTVNGPAVSARNRDAVVAWFSAPKEEGHAFVAFSRDGGRTFGQPVRLDDAIANGHVDVEMLAMPSLMVINPPDREPIYWFAILERALAEGDFAQAAEAIRQLATLGIDVRYRCQARPQREVTHAG